MSSKHYTGTTFLGVSSTHYPDTSFLGVSSKFYSKTSFRLDASENERSDYSDAKIQG